MNAEGWSPAEKLFGFVSRQGTRKLNKMEVRRSSSTREDSAEEAPPRQYDTGEVVWYRATGNQGEKRIKGIILKRISGVMYEIRIEERIRKAHINQLSKYTVRHKLYETFDPIFYGFEPGSVPVQPPPARTLRRSTRIRCPPRRYDPQRGS